MTIKFEQGEDFIVYDNKISVWVTAKRSLQVMWLVTIYKNGHGSKFA